MLTEPPKVIEVELERGGRKLRWVWRIPTRADDREAMARFAAKLARRASSALEAQLVDSLDGPNLMWEAMLEVGLVPRRLNGTVVDLGETAPEHWFAPVKDAQGQEIARMVVFDHVPPEEFVEVVRELDRKKKTAIRSG